METYLKLKRFHQRFIDEWVECGNRTVAYRKLRPKAKRPRELAYKLCQRPEILQAYEERCAEAIEAAGVTNHRILEETARIAFANLKHLYDAEGKLLPIDQWPEDAARAVVGIDFEALFENRGEDRRQIGHIIKLKTAPKVEALRMLGEFRKLWTKKHELAGPNGKALPPTQVVVVTQEEAERLDRELDSEV